MVFDEGNIEADLAAELDVGPGEEVKRGLLQSAFCGGLSASATAREAEQTCSWG